MLKSSKINYNWKTICSLLSTQVIQTLELQTDKKQVNIRKPSQPLEEASYIYKATGCKQTIPKKTKYVVYC